MLGDGKEIERVEKTEVKIPVDSASENVVTEKTEESTAVSKEGTEVAPTVSEEIIGVISGADNEDTLVAKGISEPQMLRKKAAKALKRKTLVIKKLNRHRK